MREGQHPLNSPPCYATRNTSTAATIHQTTHLTLLLLYNLSGVDMAPNASSSTQSRFDMLTAYIYNARSIRRKSGDAYGKIGLDAEVARVPRQLNLTTTPN